MTPEGRVKARLKKVLSTNGSFQYWPVPGGYGKQMVDCLAWRKGIALAIETKRQGETEPTPRQATIMREMRAHGVKTYVVTMNDIGHLVWLEQLD